MNLLFWRKSEPVLNEVGLLDKPSEVPAPVAVKEPVPVALAENLTIPVNEFTEYRRIADKIGWKSASVVDERFRHFFAENGIIVFSLEKVESFLDSEFGLPKDGAPTWYWRPLREKDMQAQLEMNKSGCKNGKINNDDWYQLKVPLPVLMIIEKIHDEIPEACFYISESVEEGDPFLMVTGPGSTGAVFVIERWNEPSFRM